MLQNQASSRKMKRLFLYAFGVICLVVSYKTTAQTIYGKHPYKGVLEVTGGLGVTYYQGDLRESPLKNLQLGPNAAIGLTYRLGQHFSLRAEARLYNVGGSQKNSKKTQNSLDFRTTNPDGYLALQADLFKYTNTQPFNAYVYGGFGFTHLNPTAVLNGKRYALAPLKTEGVAYNRQVWIAPGGIGITYRHSQALKIGLEVNGTYVNSDYLDDVSTTYTAFADQNSIAARLADRRIDLGLTPNQVGFIRGNPKNKDLYVMLSIRAVHRIGSSKRAIQKLRTKCIQLD